MEGDKVQVPANPDNDVKATVIREDLQLDREFVLPLQKLSLVSDLDASLRTHKIPVTSTHTHTSGLKKSCILSSLPTL